jgi:hypothetical protein
MSDGDIHPALISRTQRGFLLITAVVLIVTVGLLAAVITFLSAGNVLSGAGHANSAKALFVAESGMERALYGFKAGTACASLSSLTPPGTVGEGDFSLMGTLYNPATPVTIAVDIGTTDTVIPVNADPRTSGYATHGRLTIGTEALSYAGVATTGCSGAPACFTGVTRGVAGTTAVDPAIGDAVLQNQCVIRSTGVVGGTKRFVERAVSSSGGSSRAMAVYAKLDGDRVPYYRIWDGSIWGIESTALAVGTAGNDIRIHFIVLKFARTRNEAILGIQYLDNTTGLTEISVQRWNGTSWVGLTTLVTGIGGGDDDRRGFDIEYETANDRAVVVYRLTGNSTEDPDFRIWNGSSWTAPATIIVQTTQAPRWIELAPNPISTSNEIAMMLVDRNDDVYGMAWTGAAWGDMGVAAVWDDADDSVTKTIDVAYEQQSGRALFIWADDFDDRQRYRLWNGASLSGIGDLTIGAMSGQERGEWLRLAPQTGSNNILYAVQGEDGDLNTRFWDGGAWDGAGPHPEHDDFVEDTRDRNFDIVFETYGPNTHLAWLVWGDGGTLSRRQWNSTTSLWGPVTTTGDNTALVQLMAHPTSGVVLAAIYEDRAASGATEDLREMHLPAGGSWTPLTNPSSTPTDPFWSGRVVNNPVLERVNLAPYRFGFEIYDWIEVFP